MMKTIHAIFADGVFKPTAPVNLPENTEVEVELHSIGGKTRTQPELKLSRHVGVIKQLPIDPLEFQKRIREEWD